MQTNAQEIMAQSQDQLLAILKDPASPLFDKAKACQRLAVIGTAEAVPVLATLLSDPKLAHYARFALQPIPGPAVDEALRTAMGKLKGELLVGVIDSIGWRRDASAESELIKLMGDKDSEVAGAAAAALGRIGSPHAAAALEHKLRKAKGQVLEATADACLVCAEGLSAQGRGDEAQSLYAALRRPEVPKPARIAATER